MRFEFNDDSQKICNSVDVVNYGIQCDICGNKVLSVSNINGKRYCAGCYYKTFMKDNQKAEIDQLKQQLAEKEKENEELKLKLDIRAMNLQNINTERMEAVRNQTQLAIQELEKVKEKIDCEMAIREYNISEQTADVCVSIAEQIDQQIKELKGEKDVED